MGMIATYLTDWVYVWLFIVAGAALVVVILLFSKVINPSHPTPEKLSTYECGIPPVGNPWAPFAVRYYVFALLFLVFDVEAVFLFPWAIVFRSLGTAGFVEMLLFIAVLGVGLLYAWRKGALEWA
jgi:NADH-quinone oxidoreductase subunit A